MKEVSLLIGGKAGDGINQAGTLLAQILAKLGLYVYMYFDYPSLIRGGHNFAIIRASKDKILSHREKVDYILAINQDSIDLHKDKLKDSTRIIFDSDTVKAEGIGFPLSQILKEEGAKSIMRNSVLVGALARCVGIQQGPLESVIKKHIDKDTDLNLKLVLRGYRGASEFKKLESLTNKDLPVITGNEAIGLGLINAGLEAYIAYPMTPTSNLLHFMAGIADKSNLKVIHPESEIGVILMALGFSYEGKRAAVGTSGGGFCLMTEGLSLASMAELPIVIVVGQRPGPSTGMPTYSAQSDLHFVLNAGHGEFARFVIAPGDPEEAYFWSGIALNMSWKYQIPAIILSDKTLNEGVFSFDQEEAGSIQKEEPVMWDKKGTYKRYSYSETGVSPLTFVPDKNAVIKVNSYEHDESGITTEDPEETTEMYNKRLRKEKYLQKELETYSLVKTYGDNNSSTALLCWGSNKGNTKEVGENLGFRIIQPLVLSPFPLEQLQNALKGVKKLIVVENNATAQLARLVSNHGILVQEKILKYNGRPFTVEELEEKIKRI